MDSFSDTPSCAHPNKSLTQSLDSDVYMHVEINSDESLPGAELKVNSNANEDKENCENDRNSPNNKEELAGKEYKNFIDRLNPDPPTADAAEMLEVSTSTVSPELDTPKSPRPSILVFPPPLPPKNYRRASQSPGLRDLIEEGKSIYQTPSLKDRIKGYSQFLDPDTEKIPDIHKRCTFKIEPTVELKQSPRPSPKPPKKPPRHNIQNRTEQTEGQHILKHEVDQGKHEKKVEEKGGSKAQELTKGGNDRMISCKTHENLSNIVLNKKVNSALLPPDKTSDIVETTGNFTSAILAKPEAMISPQPPTKPQKKDRPISPFKPPQPCSADEIAKKRERKDQDSEQGKDEDLLDKEYGVGCNRDSRLTPQTITEISAQQDLTVMESLTKSSLNVVHELQENQNVCQESQHTETKSHSTTDGPIGVESNIEKLKSTEDNKDFQITGQEISKLLSDCGTEVLKTKLDLNLLEDAQETGDTVVDGQLGQTNQKPSPGRRLKNLAKKIVCKFKEGKEEKRRNKTGGVEVDHAEGTQADTGARDEEESMDKYSMDQSAMTEMQTRFKRRHVTSDSPFGSFKVYSPVKLVEELLSGEEWSKFLSTEISPPESPSSQTQLENTGQCSDNLQSNSSTEVAFRLGVFEGSAVVSETESVYEDIRISCYNTEQQDMKRSPSATPPQTLVEESDTSHMSLRTKGIYETVEFIQPVQEASTSSHLPTVKSNGVLDNSIQKYLIKLSKKRKHNVRKQRRGRRHHTDSLGQSLSSTSLQIFPASIFYHVPTSSGVAEQQQLSTVMVSTA